MTIEPKEEDNMKQNKGKTFYISRAKQDIRDLFIYFNITRPKHEKAYFKEGKFSVKELVRQMDFLEGWSRKSRVEKKSLAKYYTLYSKTFNYVFGIPKDLIVKVAGVYYDEDGKQHRVNYHEIVDELIKEGFIKVVNAGRKFERTEDGQYKVKCWWCKKYIMANRKQWYRLMSEDKYDDINKYGSDRLRKIVFKWAEQFISKQPIDKKDMSEMFYSKGIGVEDVVILSYKLFNTDRERIEQWLKKHEATKDSIHWKEQAKQKEMREFWARVYFGNIRSGDYDDKMKNWVYRKYKEEVKD